MKIIIDTESLHDGRIFQTIRTDLKGIEEIIMQTVIHTREEQTKQALIGLGWTPPKEEKE